MQLKRILYWVTIAFLVLVIVICGTMIVQKLITDARDKADNEQLLSTMPSMERPPITTGPDNSQTSPSAPPITEPGVPEVPTEPTILWGYQTLYEMNNDMVGFIEIPGTSIKYPVVQSKYQANFYLRKNFYKVGASCGTIYVREACDVFEPSDNVTIYGHKMRNGTMFADLHLYKDKDFWEDNQIIHFDTLYEFHDYEIFAVFQTEANHPGSFNYHMFDDAKDAAEFDEFVSKCKNLAYYDTGITPQYGDKLITLSTCDKDIEDGRLVVVARRIQ